MTDSAGTIRILSINIWDLPIPLPFTSKRRRLNDLLRRFPAEGADIVLFQEVFRPRFRQQMAAHLNGYHADPFLRASRRLGPLRMDRTGGLVTLSRWPIEQARFIPARHFAGKKPDEQIGRKGWMWTTLATPAGSLHVANVHLYAGNSPRDARVRGLEVRHMLRSVPSDGPVLLAGDFNMAVGFEMPEHGPTGFDLMRRAGLDEVADGLSDGMATMSPSTNRWANYVLWHRPDRRLTQVFTRGLSVVTPPRLALDDPPVSDHYGLVVELAITR